MQESYLDKMLNSITNVFSKNFNITIVVVDNSNSINICDFFETHIQLSKQIKIKILKNDNTGYLNGLSYGARHIPSSNNNFVFLCNPDLEFQKCDWFGVLSYYKQSRVLLAPKIVTTTGKNQNPNRVRSFSKLEIFAQDLSTINYRTYKLITNLRKVLKKIRLLTRTKSIQTEKKEIWLPHGSCIIVDFKTLKDSKFFAENTFLWGEEVIIAEKARRQGAIVLFEPNLKVFHNEHSSTNKMLGKRKFEIWRKSYSIYRTYF
tara:strand:- start:225 stop:1007 length:783 start_codon:yes stop_codon:yes gene_type:complete